MVSKNDFLFEIVTEELPPKTLKNLSEALIQAIEKSLADAELSYDSMRPFATPRRLGLLIKKLTEQQPEQKIERRGPSLHVAFDKKNQPTAACIGFATSCDTTVDQLERYQNEKGAWVIFKKTEPGKTVFSLMPEIISNALKKLPIKRPMRWNNHEIEFVRPVHLAMMLYGKEIIHAAILGIQTSNETQGHRFLHPHRITIHTPSEYEKMLKNKGFVIANLLDRKKKIRKEIAELLLNKNCKALINESLLDEVTALVEWPVALFASFNKRFLNVPKEALISSIQNHQKSFPVIDARGKLLNHFITISNIQSLDPPVVIHGNEKVMNARLFDAEFFYHEDLKKPLNKWGLALKNVIFQTGLGTLADKSERIAKLSAYLAKILNGDVEQAQKAGTLSKCDLMTNMVGEFPELQGVMGKYYAQYNHEPKAVADALDEQYMPRHANDSLPKTSLGQMLALADRMDTLIGIFGMNKNPTGEKDPFGLRRAALGIIRIIIEKQLPIDVFELIHESNKLYSRFNLPNPNVENEVFIFCLERLKSWSLENGFSINEFNAVAALSVSNPYDFYLRLKAVHHFSELPEAESLALANKRVRNILHKQNDCYKNQTLDKNLLQETAEIDLAKNIIAKEKSTKQYLQNQNYSQLLVDLASLRQSVDHFFDSVMVVVDDKKLCQNRLLLLSKLEQLFLQVADISKLNLEIEFGK